MNPSLPKISQAIVVEGKDDISAVLAAVDALVICTHGYGIRQSTLQLIESAYKKQGIIIFTDPDHAGGAIRNKLTKLYPNALQAYLTKDQTERAGDIGIENAKPADIQAALKTCLNGVQSKGRAAKETEITIETADALGLCGGPGSAALRETVGAALGIGGGNSRAFLKKLQHFAITKEELITAWKNSTQKKH